MSQEQWKRLDVVARIENGTLTMAEGAQVLGLSERQMQRLRKVVEKRGRDGVKHGNSGRKSRRRTARQIVAKVVKLRRQKYDGFNDEHFTDMLAEEEKILLSRPTVRRILRAAGIESTRKRRPRKHRRRRDRKPQAGLMILWDGSDHDWLEGRGPRLCLMAAIDDATSEVMPGAHFVEQECAAGYLRVLRAIVMEKGIPASAYGDRHGSLVRNDEHWTLEEELLGEQTPTQVGRALKELAIERIDALSPQAKGRVERLWGTLQDRLVSELRLAKAKTMAEAKRVLLRCVQRHNRKFAIAPADSTSAWRPMRAGEDAERICSFCYDATVGGDNTVRMGKDVIIDIPPGPRSRSYASAKVECRQLLDASWRVYYKGALIATKGATGIGELRARKRRKPSAARQALRPTAHIATPGVDRRVARGGVPVPQRASSAAAVPGLQ